MELPDLNTALVEAYWDLDRTTHAAKQMARCSKTARKQAERATELWKASEQRIAVLEQQLHDCQPLGLPAPSSNSQSPPLQNPLSRAIKTGTQTDDTAHPVVTTADASMMTDSVHNPVFTTTKKSTQTDRASRPQTV